MNTLDSPPIFETKDFGDEAIHSVLLPGSECDIQDELRRQAEWGQTGAFHEPIVVGSFELNPSIIKELEDAFPYSFTSIDDMYISKDDWHAEKRANDSRLPLLSQDTRAYLRQIKLEYKEYVTSDLDRNTQGGIDRGYPGIALYMGMFDSSRRNPAHVDDLGSKYLIHLATLAGPATNVIVSGVNPKDFDGTGEYIKDDFDQDSLEFQRRRLHEGRVYRILSECDPHAEPIVERPVFRIFLSSVTNLV